MSLHVGALLLQVSLSVAVFRGGGCWGRRGGGGGGKRRRHFSGAISSLAISCISIYQISE